ncbi:hypothetical protein DCO58_03390 [Helicobacter saguini]|uniref:Uncharacterized protein n=1 Tax=Helicobacter saguini TaxID=1548018 RepID=A0A347VSA8_9HELI|nr:hypothetical protein [Helicobacter saguini]MWV62584.1 hypothetical protein [Helicobacter saguini]MWV66742.1 hypothetical protein [Helicobacter saguini]MWV69093.1 hypothetical protein [Helicobacter saguini]MWV71353.1 hypothetical protein [Helicobacter saguini]TLD93989.1 hypothetical protein LS64_007460 [Helicobacter saguini]
MTKEQLKSTITKIITSHNLPFDKTTLISAINESIDEMPKIEFDKTFNKDSNATKSRKSFRNKS